MGLYNSIIQLLSAAERRGTPVLLSAPRRSCEIDQSTQRFHVGCDNRCLLGKEYGGLHRRELLGRTLMILILTNQAVFVTDTSIGTAVFILTLNHADVIGDQSDAVTQNAWFRCALCAAISEEISILIQTGESWGRFPVPKNLPLGE